MTASDFGFRQVLSSKEAVAFSCIALATAAQDHRFEASHTLGFATRLDRYLHTNFVPHTFGDRDLGSITGP